MTKRKIAVVGLGGICRKAYMPILTADAGIELILYNRSPEPLAEMQATYRIEQGTNSLGEIIDRRPDAAFVLTASSTHFEIVKKLLENGIDVFVEKPATLHSWETRTLAEIADQHGRILMVAFNRRFAPLHVKAKELWGETPVGMGIFRKFRSNASHPNLEHQLIDDTIHQIDLLRFYCGEGTAVSTTHQSLPDRLLGAVCVVRLDSGGIGLIETSLQAGRWREYYSLYGGQQTMEIDAFSQVWFTSGKEKKQWDETYASSWQTTLAGRGFEGQISHFYSCIESRRMPQTSAWDSVKTQKLAEDIIKLGQET
jgi:virulence factor